MNRIEFLANLDKYKGEDHSTFLEHYGILGQKWGQRRWQNADGTFNTEGKIRYFGSKGDKIGTTMHDRKTGKEINEMIDVKPNHANIKTNIETSFNIPKKYEQYRDALHAEVSRQLMDVIKSNQGLNIPDDQKIPKKVNVNVDNNGHFKIDFEYNDPKIGGFGFREIRPNEQNLNLRKEEGEKGYQNIEAIEKMSNDEIHDFIKSVFDNNINFEGAFGSQPGANKAKEEADSELFTKKNENGRSETADKMEDAAKKFREDGDEKLADETEKTAKEMREATSMSTPERKSMTKEEKRELKNATNRAWKAATKGNWVDWLLFGIIGGAIATTISWFDIKSTAKELGIEGKSKTWSASDWDKIAYVLENGKYAFDQINQK